MELKVNNVYLPIFKTKKRYIVLRGGSGSGKSVFIAQLLLYRLLTEEGLRILALRKVKETVRLSIWKLIEDLVKEYGIKDEFYINKTERVYIHKDTGNELHFAGLDDPEKIKSIAGINTIWLEETTEFTEEDFTQLVLRVRGVTKVRKQFYITFNPISRRHWLKKKFFDETVKEALVLNTTYKDNTFLDKEYIEALKSLVKNNENYYRIYVLNEWGEEDSGARFYKHFRSNVNTSEAVYNPDLPLFISFDFNVVPYITLTIWQFEGLRGDQIDEILLPSPDNNTRALCREFKRKYKDHKTGVRIYGDPAGRHADTRTAEGHNDYTIIYEELEEFSPEDYVQNKAPSIYLRGMFINSIFKDNVFNLELYISTACEESLEEYIAVKEAPDGTKLKTKVTNKETGQRYEPNGHISDANDYLITSVFTEYYDQYKDGTKSNSYILSSQTMNTGKRY